MVVLVSVGHSEQGKGARERLWYLQVFCTPPSTTLRMAPNKEDGRRGNLKPQVLSMLVLRLCERDVGVVLG